MEYEIRAVQITSVDDILIFTQMKYFANIAMHEFPHQLRV